MRHMLLGEIRRRLQRDDSDRRFCIQALSLMMVILFIRWDQNTFPEDVHRSSLDPICETLILHTLVMTPRSCRDIPRAPDITICY